MENSDDLIILKHKGFRFRQKIAGLGMIHTIVKLNLTQLSLNLLTINVYKRKC